ncbi:MAG TPA: hypothetical protein G4N92_00705 [Anaerolineae bacterium]|nr:hypothetical protein [Anaerolineae bacterium]
MKLKSHLEFLHKYIYAVISFFAILLFLIYPNVGLYDWDKEILYTDYIKSAIFDFRKVPAFWWNSYQLAGYPSVDQSALFIGNPETLLFSPLTPLLGFLKPVVYLKLVVFLHFICGFFGILALSKKMRWRANQLRIFTALFLLSPIIIQHIAIGYLPWLNLYLFPWLLFFLLSKNLLSRGIGPGIILALVLLQGGSHVFVWLTIFVIAYQLLHSLLTRKIKQLVSLPLAFLTTLLLAFARIYLSFQSFANFSQTFFLGYSLRGFFKWALLPPFFTPKTMDDIEFFIEEYIDGVPYWDGAVFWGFLLILALCLPIILIWVKRQKLSEENSGITSQIHAVAGSSLFLLIISFYRIYQTIITFLATILSLPALQGMEKYPFRFAIVAYYGFSFVIAYYWPQFLSFINNIFIKAKTLLGEKESLLVKLDQKFQIKRKALVVLCSLMICLFFLALCLEKPFLRALHNQISNAYHNDGAQWLMALMENADVIPIESYLNKADTLYGYIRNTILFSTLFLILLRSISGNLRAISNWLRKALDSLNKIRVHALECLIIIPLLLAFTMWLRVALADPQNSSSSLSLAPPHVIMADSGEPAKITGVTHSPLHLTFFATDKLVEEIILLPDISYEDIRFLEVSSHNAVLLNKNNRLGVKIKKAGLVSVIIKPNYYLYPITITVLSWLIIIPLFIKTLDQEK